MRLTAQQDNTLSTTTIRCCARTNIPLCLPPVVMSLIGLAALSRKKGGVAVVAGKKPAPKPSALRRSGTG
jgi:hypothetical protein